MTEEFPSRLLEDAVQAFADLPGIGRRTALRLVLYLLKQEESTTVRLADALTRFRKDVHYCHICHNLSDNDTCDICSDPTRDRQTVCVVEQVQDVMAIEGTGQYRGLYHVLGGLISPMEGVGPANLELASLVERVQKEDIKEVILALSPTMEGDTTNFYISRKLQPTHVRLTAIARGVSIGDELVYADEVTLGRSIVNRVEFNVSTE
jgi:recombination protein RecR